MFALSVLLFSTPLHSGCAGGASAHSHWQRVGPSGVAESGVDVAGPSSAIPRRAHPQLRRRLQGILP